MKIECNCLANDRGSHENRNRAKLPPGPKMADIVVDNATHTHTRTHTKRSLALASWASVKSGIKGGRHAVALGRDHVAKSTTVGKGNRKSQQTRSSKLHLVNNEELPRISAE